MESYENIINAMNHLGIGHAIFQDYEGRKGVFRYVNEALARKLGYSPEELIDKKSFVELLTPESLELVRQRYEARIRGENVPSHYEISAITKNGERVVFESYIQFVLYKERPATMGFYIDITQRKLMEEEIKSNLQTQKELITALNRAPEVILITDSRGIIRYVNPAFEEVTGYAFHEVVGKKPNILKSGKHDKEFYKNFWMTVSSGKRWEGRFINKKKDGTLYIDHTVVAPVFNEIGDIVSYISIKRDITQEERFREQILQAQKMDALGAMASGVAHDFNNILGGILGYIEVLKIRYKDDSYMQNILLAIEKAGDRAKDLIDKLLVFSRKKESVQKIININLLIKDVVEMFSRTMPKNIEIKVDLDEKAPINIMANPTQIEQVLINIGINAFQAMKDEGGEIFISTKRFFPDEDFLSSHYGFTQKEYVLISISDTGCGMDDEIKKRIFEPFFTTKKNGTGLGLSISYNIIENHGGKIFVYSEKGEGTTFNIYLPIEKDVDASENTRDEDVVEGKGTILVVDDEAIIREMLGDALDILGYNSIFAKDGQEGLEKFKENIDDIDLVIIDMNMPGLTGKEVIKAIRDIKPDIRTILISGFGLNGMLKDLVREDLSTFLHKPFTLGEFSETLKRLLSN